MKVIVECEIEGCLSYFSVGGLTTAEGPVLPYRGCYVGAETARAAAAKSGWVHKAGLDLCPNHSGWRA